ncbi:hypothetical protein WG907_05045 [Sphingobium sp. AN558]|uniref:hypothetical protein n=1 Tax=Sphingobium sp. AN558 TaxID=3133442 RepID=UPI0030C0FDA3
MGKHKKLDPALAQIVEALADIMVDRDFASAHAGLSDANNPLRPLLQRSAERPVHN